MAVTYFDAPESLEFKAAKVVQSSGLPEVSIYFVAKALGMNRSINDLERVRLALRYARNVREQVVDLFDPYRTTYA